MHHRSFLRSLLAAFVVVPGLRCVEPEIIAEAWTARPNPGPSFTATVSLKGGEGFGCVLWQSRKGSSPNGGDAKQLREEAQADE